MKLRLRGDTMRLRLTRSEIESVGQGSPVCECTHFPDGTQLSYRLRLGERNFASLTAADGGQEICVEIDAISAARWANSDEIGFSGDTPFTVGPLAILIEKDFTCITPRQGDEALDTYPNPNA